MPFSIFKLILTAITVVTITSIGTGAAPAEVERFPEVIPGPGLPSLASLNITSADLYKPIDPDVVSKFTLQVTPTLLHEI